MRSGIRPLRAAGLLLGVLVVAGLAGWLTMSSMPGSNPTALAPLDEQGRALADVLRRDVTVLGGEIGERNTRHPERLGHAARYLRERLGDDDLSASEESYEVDGVACSNLWVELPGATRQDEIVLVGAHYDSVEGSPGANDNGTGVAALLALARRLKDVRAERTLRLVFFVNEEPPHFLTDEMGSAVHAAGCRERGENIVAMLSLETLGYYSDEPGSQRFPVPGLGLLYPDRGDYLVLVGNLRSRKSVRSAVRTFRAVAGFPCHGAVLPAFVPGVGWSDQISFWRHGYPGMMATDTAPFRYPWYHTRHDTPEKVDYERLARVTIGIEHVVREWIGAL